MHLGGRSPHYKTCAKCFLHLNKFHLFKIFGGAHGHDATVQQWRWWRTYRANVSAQNSVPWIYSHNIKTMPHTVSSMRINFVLNKTGERAANFYERRGGGNGDGLFDKVITLPASIMHRSCRVHRRRDTRLALISHCVTDFVLFTHHTQTYRYYYIAAVTNYILCANK